jgi:hypothetical protein
MYSSDSIDHCSPVDKVVSSNDENKRQMAFKCRINLRYGIINNFLESRCLVIREKKETRICRSKDKLEN